MKVGIIDTGICNVGSVSNMLKRIGAEAKIINKGKDLDKIDKLILPGVGAFDSGIKKLRSLDLLKPIQDAVANGSYILGICLGMQMLGANSEEGIENGLNLIPGEVKKFTKNNKLPIPHMGWNNVIFTKNKISANLLENKFYFVHSYYFKCTNDDHSIGVTKYGEKFTSIINKNNIFGVQFHPEKSHKNGIKLFTNYINL